MLVLGKLSAVMFNISQISMKWPVRARLAIEGPVDNENNSLSILTIVLVFVRPSVVSVSSKFEKALAFDEFFRRMIRPHQTKC